MTGKTIAIIQSNYIPWKGYFDLINMVDEFVLYDDVQFTRRDWRNRNRIKTRDGLRWMTIPASVKGNYKQSIIETRIADRGWAKQHFATIRHNYSRAPFFAQYEDELAHMYLDCSLDYLSEINHRFLEGMCSLLGISTSVRWSSDYRLVEGRTERLVDLCAQLGAQEYLCGPSSKSYLEESIFHEAGIAVKYMDYSTYPEYPQLFPPFEHGVSIVDLLLNVGNQAARYMQSL